ncbi:integrase [Streptomyces europaeiscabiei]|uniref:integrase n=1 Tax=Streptomyces europaeiscabiei TaxID=146819 RepID=UPI002E19A149
MTVLLATGRPRPTAQTPVIDAALVVSPDEPMSCYGDATWSLAPLNANPSVERKSIHWTKFPPTTAHELRQITHTFINRSLPDSFLRGRSGAWRTRMNAESIYEVAMAWRDFARWLHAADITTLADHDDQTYSDFIAHLVRERGLSRSTVLHRMTALTRLWVFDTIGTAPFGVTQPPWEHEGVDDYLPPATEGGGENSTEPITPATMGPLLIWAMRTVDDLATDILAAWTEKERLIERAEKAVATNESLASLKTYLHEIAAADGPIPMHIHAGKDVTSVSYIAGLTGASIGQVSSMTRRKAWRDYRARHPGPSPLPTNITALVNGRRWAESVDFADADVLMRHLGTACFIVLAYLTGMRPGEVLGLRTDCCPEPATGRHLIFGNIYKTARDENGNHHSGGELREAPWVAIEPAVNAIRILEKIVPGDSLLFDASAHDFPNHRPGYAGSLLAHTMNSRIEDFILWANDMAHQLDLPTEAIPPDPHGRVGTSRFRRTLAWHIARRPGGLVALAVQYGHLRTTVSAGYAARSRDGIHTLLDIETARATADTLMTLQESLAEGTGLSGPAARRAIHAAAHAPTFAGSIRTARQARDILGNPALAVHDNPHAYLMCVYNRDKALCHRTDAADTPSLDRCVSSCANITRTDQHTAEMTWQAESLEKQAASKTVPLPLADRLRDQAGRLRKLVEHHRNSRITREETSG